jgi:hypothetical protein
MIELEWHQIKRLLHVHQVELVINFMIFMQCKLLLHSDVYIHFVTAKGRVTENAFFIPPFNYKESLADKENMYI